MTTIRLERRAGTDLLPLLPALGALRVEVFRAWPYLYDGDQVYEVHYLQTYVKSPRAAIIVAFDGETPVGASTCLPMTDETDNVQAPFRAAGIDPARVFYFGESVLRDEYRGQGIGVGFFREREAHARAVSDCDYACFCGVQRPVDHPARPPGFVPLDAFWRKRGYTPYPSLTCTMLWRDVGAAEESDHTLMFWLRALRDAALP